MKKIIFLFIGFIVCSFALFSFDTVFADSVKNTALEQLNAGADTAGYGTEAQDPRIVAARMITFFMSGLGIVVTGLFMFAGYNFVTSHGVEEKITKARKTMQAAVIGLIVIMLAFSISYFLGKQAQEVTGIGTEGTPMQYK